MIQQESYLSVADNSGAGITAGGYGHVPTKTSLNNVFLGNRASGNGGTAWNPMHGAASNNFWLGNTAGGAGAGFDPLPGSNANVSIFEPGNHRV